MFIGDQGTAVGGVATFEQASALIERRSPSVAQPRVTRTHRDSSTRHRAALACSATSRTRPRQTARAAAVSNGLQRATKSMIDRTIAGLSLIVLLPVFVVIAAAVRLSSKGAVFYLQTRVGQDGKPFRMVKFRSMRRNADALVEELREDNEAADGLLFKIRADPRVTRVGRVLRKYSLDELPQLINVLGGSMSLVGPRPALPAEVEQYDHLVRRRLVVKPGLTGAWQVAGRSDLPWEDAVRLDLHYVDEWSLRLDLLILARTPRAVLSATGAY